MRSLNHLQDFDIFRAAGTLAAGAGKQDFTARFDDRCSPGDSFDGLVEIAVKRCSGVGRDNEIEWLLKSSGIDGGNKTTPLKVGLNRIAGKNFSDLLGGIKGYINNEIGSGLFHDA